MIYGRKWHEYAKQWDTMTINASRRTEASRAAQYAVDNKLVYLAVQQATDVPWPMVAINHRRESGAQDALGNPLFTTYLGNGQLLLRKTTIVPIGRGPFIGPNAFLMGATDAYRIDRLDQIKDWRLEKILYYSELFNGAGYADRGLPSPYLWGGTNIQKAGKFIVDHRFSKNTVDKQLGCCAILKMIENIDGWTIARES